MGTGVLFQDMGKDEHIVDQKRVDDAMKSLKTKLEKKAAELHKKLENKNLSPKKRRNLRIKIHVIEAQIEHGYKGDLTH